MSTAAMKPGSASKAFVSAQAALWAQGASARNP